MAIITVFLLRPEACPARPLYPGSPLTAFSSSPLQEAGWRRAAEKGSPQLREGDNFSRESLAEVAGGEGKRAMKLNLILSFKGGVGRTHNPGRLCSVIPKHTTPPESLPMLEMGTLLTPTAPVIS